MHLRLWIGLFVLITVAALGFDAATSAISSAPPLAINSQALLAQAPAPGTIKASSDANAKCPPMKMQVGDFEAYAKDKPKYPAQYDGYFGGHAIKVTNLYGKSCSELNKQSNIYVRSECQGSGDCRALQYSDVNCISEDPKACKMHDISQTPTTAASANPCGTGFWNYIANSLIGCSAAAEPSQQPQQPAPTPAPFEQDKTYGAGFAGLGKSDAPVVTPPPGPAPAPPTDLTPKVDVTPPPAATPADTGANVAIKAEATGNVSPGTPGGGAGAGGSTGLGGGGGAAAAQEQPIALNNGVAQNPAYYGYSGAGQPSAAPAPQYSGGYGSPQATFSGESPQPFSGGVSGLGGLASIFSGLLGQSPSAGNAFSLSFVPSGSGGSMPFSRIIAPSQGAQQTQPPLILVYRSPTFAQPDLNAIIRAYSGLPRSGTAAPVIITPEAVATTAPIVSVPGELVSPAQAGGGVEVATATPNYAVQEQFVQIGSGVASAHPVDILSAVSQLIAGLLGGWTQPQSGSGAPEDAALAQAQSDYQAIAAQLDSIQQAEALGLCDSRCFAEQASLQTSLSIQLQRINDMQAAYGQQSQPPAFVPSPANQLFVSVPQAGASTLAPEASAAQGTTSIVAAPPSGVAPSPIPPTPFTSTSTATTSVQRGSGGIGNIFAGVAQFLQNVLRIFGVPSHP